MKHLLKAKQIEFARVGDRLNDGGGLRCRITGKGPSWSLRKTLNGRKIEISLGNRTLADARKAAIEAEEHIDDGVDPRAADRYANANIKDNRITFGQYLEDWFANKKQIELTNAKEKRVWCNALHTYLPNIMRTPIEAIDLRMVAEELRPIWLSKPEMADRTRLRAAQVMKSATAIGLYDKANPFDRSLLTEILPNIRHKVVHHKAIPFEWAPKIYSSLCQSNAQSAYALRGIMLTATRSNEGRGMCFSEIDEDEWTIPAERMKGGEEFMQLLSPAMINLLGEVPVVSDRVFAGPGGKNPYVSTTAVSKQVQRLAGEGYTVHGMRSCFKDWCAENGVDDLVSEVALSHQDKDKVRAAYLRTNFIDERRRVMDDWGRYLQGYRT